MYKIGEFSKITKLSVKTLRYYDNEKILTPSFRNEENGYRYYNEEDFKKAEMIMLLRELDFSISEVKDVISLSDGEDDLSYIFEEKKAMVKKKIAQQEELLKKLSFYTNMNPMEKDSRDYKIETKSISEVTVASIRYKGKYSDVGNYIKTIYKEIKGSSIGASFNCYYDSDYKEAADIEICVPVKKLIESPNIVCKRLPSIKCISIIHNGPYEEINKAYKAIFDYINKNNIISLLPSREIYIKGPGMIFKGNPKKYITEIIIPIEVN